MLDDQAVRRLLLATAARDVAAFEALYRKTAPLLLAVARRIVGRQELAEEVLHDAFIRIWNAAAGFDPSAPKPVAWLVAIARNRAIDIAGSADHARVAASEDLGTEGLDQILDPEPAADEGLASGRRAAQVRDCIDGLEAAERQAVVLAYHHGLSHGELARHLGRPLGTVKGWVRRAMEHLRACLEGRLGEGDEARRAP